MTRGGSPHQFRKPQGCGDLARSWMQVVRPSATRSCFSCASRLQPGDPVWTHDSVTCVCGRCKRLDPGRDWRLLDEAELQEVSKSSGAQEHETPAQSAVPATGMRELRDPRLHVETGLTLKNVAAQQRARNLKALADRELADDRARTKLIMQQMEERAMGRPQTEATREAIKERWTPERRAQQAQRMSELRKAKLAAKAAQEPAASAVRDAGDQPTPEKAPAVRMTPIKRKRGRPRGSRKSGGEERGKTSAVTGGPTVMTTALVAVAAMRSVLRGLSAADKAAALALLADEG